MADEIGWLVERDGKYRFAPCSRYEWQNAMTGCEPDLWTSNANLAIRFARKADAESYIRWEGLSSATATEHMWCDHPHATETERDAAVQRFKQRLHKMFDEAADRINAARTCG